MGVWALVESWAIAANVADARKPSALVKTAKMSFFFDVAQGAENFAHFVEKESHVLRKSYLSHTYNYFKR